MLRRLGIIVVAVIFLTGCKTLTVDEAFVFQPGQFGNSDAPRLTTLRYEDIFETPRDMGIKVWADGQTAHHVISSDSFIKSEVRHDFIPYGSERLAVTHIKRPGRDRPLIIHCGGNASDRYESGALYAQKMIGFADVLMFDYPGYGDSTGRADAESLSDANQALVDYIGSEFALRPTKILWGHSLGGFVCADMAKRIRSIEGVILEATATNAQDVSKAVIPWYAKLFIRSRVAESLSTYDITQLLQVVDAPILILGAAKDKTLPVALSRKLSDRLKASGQDVTYVEFPDANHISIPTQESFGMAVERFIGRVGSRDYKAPTLESAALKLTD